jgi:uncharacterized membrane protein
MTRFAHLLFVLLLAIAAIIITTTTGQLPEQVASHFGGSGAANGSMSRSGYLVFMLAIAIGVPLVVALMVGTLPRMMVKAINIPNREFWLADPRREGTLRFLSAHACWLGSLLVVFTTRIHLLLLAANATQPPRLPGTMFVTLLAAFLVGMAIWIVALHVRFRNKG